MIRVTLYSRPECHLCDQARSQLAALQAEVPHQLVEVDVTSDLVLLGRYGEKVPVVQSGPYTLHAPFSQLDLKVALQSARDRDEGKPLLTGGSRVRAIRADRIVLSFARHWLAAINLLVFLYVGLPFAAPVLMKAGAVTPARLVYRLYSPLCHQLAFRTWFLFGEQIAYPMEAAGTSLVSYEEALGLDPNDVLAARAFVGDERVGYKVALCQRDVAIYGGLLFGGLAFGLLRRRLRPLPLWIWALFGVLPIAIDGGTQLLGVFPFLSFLARESTPFLRTLTGGVFGILNVWMAYPYVQESMDETVAALVPKLAAVGRQSRPAPTS